MKKLLCLLLAAVFAVSLASCGDAKIVKTIGGYDVDSELNDFYDGDDSALSVFLAPYALADKYGYDTSSGDFSALCEAELARMLHEDYLGDEDALEEDIKANGLSTALYEKFVERDVLTSELYSFLKENGTIESDEAKIRESLLAGGAVYVKRIVIVSDDGEELIAEASEKAKTAPFESVRDSFAEYAPAGEIGNYGDGYIVVRGSYDEKYEDACFSLGVGEISEPFNTDAGWCIVKRYELTEDMVDGILPDLAAAYTDGIYTGMLSEAAAGLLETGTRER